MKNISSSPSLSAGLTFTIALWCLGVIAAAQVIAVVWRVVPAVVIRSAVNAPEVIQPQQTSAYRPPQLQVAPQPALPSSRPSQPDPAQMQEATAFVAEAEKSMRVGEWETAFSALAKAREILPAEPSLHFQYAYVLDRLGRVQEAYDELNLLIGRKDIPPEIRNEALRVRNLVAQTIDNMEQRGIPTTPRPRASANTSSARSNGAPADSQTPFVDEVGLQPGAALGIVEAREIDGDNGVKTLRIAIKNRPEAKITSADVKVIVRFFEVTPDGDITLTESSVNSQWISPPIDWSDNEPEILDVVYPLADPKKNKKTYYGYTVAIYFREDLQDMRAVPLELDRMFPSEVILESPLQ